MTADKKWAEKEEKRKNPNHWVEELRPQIMERIKRYESFLDKWGIIAQTGIEQEFYVIPKKLNHKMNRDILNGILFDKIPYFPNSPFIEDIKKDHDGENGFEISIGIGNQNRQKDYPHQSLKPSTMVIAAEQSNKLICKEAAKPNNQYEITGISFDPTNLGKRMWAQQVNISLWNKNTKKPLFNGFNELSRFCLKNTLDTQNSLVAFLTVNDNCFNRFNARETFYNQKTKQITFSDFKSKNPSIMLRYRKDNEGIGCISYLENRLGNSDMPPSVNMLITLAGVAKGVEEYIKTYNIKSPEELFLHLEKNKKHYNIYNSSLPEYELPTTQAESLKTTESSQLAKEILGETLHKKFISEYKEQCLNLNNKSHISL